MTLLRNLHHHFSHHIYQFGNQLLPTQCLLCGYALKAKLVCDGCKLDLPWIQHHQYRCKQCALALESAADYCGHCLKQPPAFSYSVIPFSYQYPLNILIQRFKYRRKLESGKLLGTLFAQYLLECAHTYPEWRQPDLLMPTPMHWTRRWHRGFNQADVLSHYLAEAIGIPLNSNIIQRVKRTPAQKELTRSERQKNLRSAFYLSPQSQNLIQNKSIALVDDVVTTTATMRELSKLLLQAGAKEIQVWALARTMDK